MKIAYAGFDLLYPALESLHKSGCEVVKIFSCKVDNVTEFNTKTTEFAHAHDIPITYDKITYDDLIALKESGVEALFCGAYYYKIPILKDFKMINIHPSFLPIGRGAWPMPVAILNEHKESGVTFHKMEESFDSGDILIQRSFFLSDNENLSTFMEKIYNMLPDMIKELLSDFSHYYDNAQPQSTGEYWECPDENDYVITTNTDYNTADRILRAFKGFYVIYEDNNSKTHLLNAVAVKGDNTQKQYKIKDGYLTTDSTK